MIKTTFEKLGEKTKIKMINQMIEVKSPIKVMPSESYLLVFEDADKVTHFWHKKHTAIIEGKTVKCKEGQYDGWSRELKEKD